MKHVVAVILCFLVFVACVEFNTLGFYGRVILDGDQSTTVENAPLVMQSRFLEPRSDDTSIVRLFVLGDWGSGSAIQRDIAHAMARQACHSRPHVIISTGDNFYPSGVRSPDDRLFEERWERMYGDSCLQVPWIIALGNHDHRGNIVALREYSLRNRRWYFPSPYYATTIGAGETVVALFVLDTDSLLHCREDCRRQLHWLDSSLAATVATVKIVVGHHPVRSYGFYGDTRILIEQLKPILDRRNVALYLSGHDHDVQIVEHPDDRFVCIVSGAGGHARRTRYGVYTRFAWTNGGFVSLHCAANGKIFVRVFARDGKAVWSDTINVASVHRQGLEPRTR